MRIRSKYIGPRISGLWATSHLLAREKKVVLTAYGFVDRNENLIPGTDKTAAMLLASARAGRVCLGLDFSKLEPEEFDPAEANPKEIVAQRIRDVFRRVIRCNETYHLNYLSFDAQLDNLLYLRGQVPARSIKYAFGRRFYENSLPTQFLKSATWGIIPSGLLILAYAKGWIGSEHPEKLFWLTLTLGMFLSGVNATIKSHYYAGTLRENLTISLVRLLSDVFIISEAFLKDRPKSDQAKALMAEAGNLLERKIDFHDLINIQNRIRQEMDPEAEEKAKLKALMKLPSLSPLLDGANRMLIIAEQMFAGTSLSDALHANYSFSKHDFLTSLLQLASGKDKII
jgi:hypothetical protein